MIDHGGEVHDPDDIGGSRQSRVLDPTDRLSEIVFGLLMALSFTGTMSVAVHGGQNVRSVLLAALGCNLAWGIVDGVMFLLSTAVERARRQSLWKALRTSSELEAVRMLQVNMPQSLGIVLSGPERHALLLRARGMPDGPQEPLLQLRDFRAAVSIFALVVVSTLPPSLPFLAFDHLPVAMRTSNLIAVVMLCTIGARLGFLMGRRMRVSALMMGAIGTVLVAITIALGG